MPPITNKPALSQDTRFTERLSKYRVVRFAWDLLFDRQYFSNLVVLLFIAELFLGLLIINKVPYTKIDWDAYMQQVECFLAGERDYSQLHGETGPAVYPALYLYIYTALYKLLPTENRIRAAQYVFLGLYLITFLIISRIYYLSGTNLCRTPLSRHVKKSKGTEEKMVEEQMNLDSFRISPFPQALLIPLCLSKRLHSIYVLRLFNDPWCMILLYISVLFMMRRDQIGWRLGSLIFSLALGVKMNVILFLPGLLLLLVQYRGLLGLIESIVIILLVQIALPLPYFLGSKSHVKLYLSAAFNFSRQFEYKWTVNWRWIDEKAFLSKKWALGLLLAQITFFIIFGIFKANPKHKGNPLTVLKRALQYPSKPAIDASSLPDYHIPLTLFTSNFIGMVFARSLHYQFYCWYAHQLPFLLYTGGAMGILPIGVMIWLGVEYAWETYPSTVQSSSVLMGCHNFMMIGLLSYPFSLFFHRSVGTIVDGSPSSSPSKKNR